MLKIIFINKYKKLMALPADAKRDSLLIFFSMVIGYFGLSSAYPGHSRLLLLAPFLWCIASNRYSAFLVFFSYNMLGARGLLPGAAVFLSEDHSALQAFLLWLSINLGCALPFLVFWHKKPFFRALCFFAAFAFAYVLPPISLIGIINPVIGGAAATLPAGAGVMGLCSILFLIACSCFSKRLAIFFSCVIFFYSFFPAAFIQSPSDFYAVNTSFGRLGSGSFSFSSDFDRATLVFSDLRTKRIRQLEERYVVLPETIAGRVNKASIDLWTQEISSIRRNDQVFFWGGEIPTGTATYDNCIFIYHGDDVHTIEQRVPVPYSMYRPFTKTGANLHYFSDGILLLPDGRRAAVLICYESFLTWPALVSMLKKPDIIICASNLWWCKDTSIPSSQERYVTLWGRLFNIPTVFSVNK